MQDKVQPDAILPQELCALWKKKKCTKLQSTVYFKKCNATNSNTAILIVIQ